MKRKDPKALERPKKRLTPLLIALIYLAVGGTWILLSDRFVEMISKDPDTLTHLQTYKGWLFILLTALMLYWLIRSYGSRIIDALEKLSLREAALKESETKFRTLLEQSPFSTLIFSPDGRIAMMNQSFRALWGASSEDAEYLIGNYNVLQDEQLASVGLMPYIRKGFEGEYAEIPAIEYDLKKIGMVSSTGLKKKWVKGFIYPVKDESGNVRQVVLMHEDITGRKQAEEALRESERQTAFLAELLEKSSQPFAVGYLDGRLLRVNAAYSDLTGYGRDEIMKLDWARTLTPPEWRDTDRMHLEELTLTGQPVRYKKEYIRKDGSRVPVEMFAHIAKDEQGKTKYYYAFVTDITERKRSEERIMAERDFSNSALNSLPGIVYLFNQEGRFLRWNRNFEIVSEYSPEEIARMNPLDFFSERDRELIRERIRQTFEKGAADAEAEFVTRSGRHKSYYYTGRVIRVEGEPCLIGMGIDITERKRIDDELRKSEEQFRRLTQQSPVPIAISNQRGDVELVNESFIRTFGYTLNDIPHIDAWFRLAYPDPAYRREVIAKWKQAVDAAIREQRVITPQEYRVTCKNGTVRIVEIFGSLIGNKQQVLFSDVTQRKRAEKAVEESMERFRNLVEATSDWVWEVDENGVYTYASPKVRDILGYQPEEVLGKTPFDFMPPDEARRVSDIFGEIIATRQPFSFLENVNLHKDGRRVILETSGVPFFDPEGTLRGYRGIDRDITGRKRAEETIKYQAYHDLLTGLPNKALFVDLLNHEIFEMEREGKGLAVLFLDIDQFKKVNDSLGHEAGDSLIRNMAVRLRSSLREFDTVARIGGDEFNILLPLITSPEDASKIAAHVMENLKQPFLIADHEFRVTASIGISIYPEDGANAESLMKNADIALYHAKDQGRDNYQFYSASINFRTLERIIFENRLRQAVEHGELVVYYQPQQNIKTGKITGAEALVRWNHPDLGLLNPAQFVPLAEEIGLIIPIDQWVLRTACRDLKAWEEAGHGPLYVSTNLSARQFRQPGLAEMISHVLTESRLRPDCLGIEITETLLMEDTAFTARNLNSLNAMGVRFLVDDFGTGYSSLSYLKKLPIQKLKIDKSFITHVAGDHDYQAIINAIIAMAHILKLKVVAEGVETDEQLSYLSSRDCDEMQGYHFSKPIPADEFERVLIAAAEEGRLAS